MRVIAGEFRGRRLKTLPGRDVRPTSDRLRETLFNILREEVPGSVFIDCFAGSGAVGIEALSRGARQAIFIEQSAAAARVIRENIGALQLDAVARLIQSSARQALKRLADEHLYADICFLDPPYATHDDALKLFALLVEASLIRPTGIVVVQHARKAGCPDAFGDWRRTRHLQQGSNALSFYRRGEVAGTRELLTDTGAS